MRDRTYSSQAAFAVRVRTLDMVSETDSTKTWTVTLPHCTCPSFRFNLERFGKLNCKHLNKAKKYRQWHAPGAAS